MKHKSEIPKDPRELNTQIPDDLSKVILRCMEKDKEKRYQIAGEVRSELENIEKGIPTTERIVPKRKPITSREITVTFGLKKLFIPALVVVALVIIAVVIWRPWSQKETVPIPPDKPSLAVMYFENNTGDEGLDHYRKAISDLLITDLAQSKHIRVIRGDRLFNILRQLNLIDAEIYSSEDLKEVASRGRATHVLQGTYTKAGENFRVNYMLHEASTEELIGSESVAGKGEESIFSMVDELTRRIKANFKLSAEEIASDFDKELAQITTQSPEAYKYFSDGVKLYNQGRVRASIPLLERAIGIDPDFAMAYRKLGFAYHGLGLIPKAKECLEKAMGLKGRLSDKERFMIEGNYYSFSENTYDKSRAAYERLLELYPEDAMANHNLALIFYSLDQWKKAIPYYEKARKARVFVTYSQLASCYRAIGEDDKAKEVLDDYLENIEDSAAIHQGLAAHYWDLGKYDLALSEVEKALSLDPTNFLNINAQALVYEYQEDLKKAENTYWKLLGLTEPGAGYWAVKGLCSLNLIWGKYEGAKSWFKQGINYAREIKVKWAESEAHTKLAFIHIQTGRPGEALKECEEAWESAVQAENLGLQRSAMHMKGLAQLANHSLTEAQKTADELQKFIETGIHEKSIRLYHHLMGRIEIEKGNYPKAVDLIQQALSLTLYQRDTLFIDSLALAHYKAGDYKKAQEQYKRLLSLTPGGVFYGDLYAKSFYMLGKTYEQQGATSKALEHYQKFLNLWKDADPGIAEVEDARKRLAGLKSK
jgi:tetratricopeptide (TPR) repeat protein